MPLLQQQSECQAAKAEQSSFSRRWREKERERGEAVAGAVIQVVTNDARKGSDCKGARMPVPAEAWKVAKPPLSQVVQERQALLRQVI